MIFSWHSCGGGLKAQQNETEIRQQIICGNIFVQSKDKTMFYPYWHKSDINFNDDLLDNTGNLKSGQEIFFQLQGSCRSNRTIEYNKSITHSWKDKLRNINMATTVKKDQKSETFSLYW